MSQYISGVVKLSRYKLSVNEWSLLSHGLGFCPTPGAPNPRNIFLDFEEFKRKVILFLFFHDPDNIEKVTGLPLQGMPFGHKFLENKSGFIPEAPHQLESIFEWFDNELHKTFQISEEENLIQLEFQALKSYKRN